MFQPYYTFVASRRVLINGHLSARGEEVRGGSASCVSLGLGLGWAKHVCLVSVMIGGLFVVEEE